VELYLYFAIRLNGLHGTTVHELLTAQSNIPIINNYAHARTRAHTPRNDYHCLLLNSSLHSTAISWL
jgi:hypothetical protein